ncbi:hypothetical protein P7K49_000272 [Saguinus oedipus]|uniref:Uncharacterized protein n=1 Tax=Saguinus oedipus TaxID=9490 RepID=A0ABQ9WB84_SAGOE|nr:hypothetical protein P7K49_000272 [Saguinus oedipus]
MEILGIQTEQSRGLKDDACLRAVERALPGSWRAETGRPRNARSPGGRSGSRELRVAGLALDIPARVAPFPGDGSNLIPPGLQDSIRCSLLAFLCSPTAAPPPPPAPRLGMGRTAAKGTPALHGCWPLQVFPTALRFVELDLEKRHAIRLQGGAPRVSAGHPSRLPRRRPSCGPGGGCPVPAPAEQSHLLRGSPGVLASS